LQMNTATAHALEIAEAQLDATAHTLDDMKTTHALLRAALEDEWIKLLATAASEGDVASCETILCEAINEFDSFDVPKTLQGAEYGWQALSHAHKAMRKFGIDDRIMSNFLFEAWYTIFCGPFGDRVLQGHDRDVVAWLLRYEFYDDDQGTENSELRGDGNVVRANHLLGLYPTYFADSVLIDEWHESDGLAAIKKRIDEPEADEPPRLWNCEERARRLVRCTYHRLCTHIDWKDLGGLLDAVARRCPRSVEPDPVAFFVAFARTDWCSHATVTDTTAFGWRTALVLYRAYRRRQMELCWLEWLDAADVYGVTDRVDAFHAKPPKRLRAEYEAEWGA